MFVDQTKVTLQAGAGGDGCVSFRREKGVPRGGPDGGRGGDGGSIYLVADKNIHSLTYFRFHSIIKASRGVHGEGGNRQGKKGKDLFLKVPVGTVVKTLRGAEIICDLNSEGENFLAAKGGKGGKGNSSYVSSTWQSPRRREEGQPGEEKDYVLELKLIADVGLVGFPNTGKSTLISRISSAKPRIAMYPFTTLNPHLGVVDTGDYRSFVVADIPGLIKGAHSGHGLGIQFLRHVERTRMLIHLIDVSPYNQRDPVEDYKAVREELGEYNPQLLQRKQVIAANKIDLIHKEKERLKRMKDLAGEKGIPFFAISALKNQGVKDLVTWIFENLSR
ncbi:GTPase ObgE [bacterium]|nr:GTPase ObgE [bacterium]